MRSRGAERIRTAVRGFAGLCLATRPPRPARRNRSDVGCQGTPRRLRRQQAPTGKAALVQSDENIKLGTNPIQPLQSRGHSPENGRDRQARTLSRGNVASAVRSPGSPGLLLVVPTHMSRPGVETGPGRLRPSRRCLAPVSMFVRRPQDSTSVLRRCQRQDR
jgi:hypothetical protein